MNKRWKRGSITVYATLMSFLVSQVLFVLLESSRQYELQKLYDMQTESAVESLFAAYVTPLWEHFHVLGLDGGQGEELLKLRANISKAVNSDGGDILGSNLIQTHYQDLEVVQYTRITDGNGDVFCAAVTNYMKDNLTYEAAKGIYDVFQEIKGMESRNMVAAPRNTEGIEEIPLLQDLERIQTSGFVEMLVKDPSKISKKSTNSTHLLSARNKLAGRQPSTFSIGWYEEILFQQYLISYFQNYEKGTLRDGLCYEQEYLLCGKSTDLSNLEATLGQLMTIRTSANLLYLLSDTEKMAAAETLAIALCSLAMVPEAAEAVKLILIGGWAYVEAILDVRGLLEGKKIPIWKTNKTWTSDLDGLGGLLSGEWVVAKGDTMGLDYGSYIGALLFFQGRQKLAYRAMDLMEIAVREQKGYEEFQMDHVLYDATLVVSYEDDGVFYPIGRQESSRRSFYQYRVP